MLEHEVGYIVLRRNSEAPLSKLEGCRAMLEGLPGHMTNVIGCDSGHMIRSWSCQLSMITRDWELSLCLECALGAETYGAHECICVACEH